MPSVIEQTDCSGVVMPICCAVGCDVGGADHGYELREDGVDGVGGRVEQVHVAGGLVGVVVHGPGHAVGRAGRVGDGQYRRPREGGVERDALVDGGCEHERLEGAAGGAAALGGEVELELAPAGEVAEHRLDRACAWVDGDQRRRRVGCVHERARDRGACVVLHTRVEGRAYPESAGLDPSGAEGVYELLLCPAEEVRVPIRAVQPSRPEAERRGDGPRVLLR